MYAHIIYPQAYLWFFVFKSNIWYNKGMKEFIKKNFAILLAFTFPIIFIIAVVLITYLPSFSISTNYNFIYSSCIDNANYYSYNCNGYLQRLYSVIDNELVINEIDPNYDSDNNKISDINENYDARIFLHDTKNNESREITIEEAQTFKLNNLLTSPDGVTVSNYYNRGSEFFLFGVGSSYGYYLTKGKNKSRLNFINQDNRYYYQNNFKFIGWVLSKKN